MSDIVKNSASLSPVGVKCRWVSHKFLSLVENSWSFAQGLCAVSKFRAWVRCIFVQIKVGVCARGTREWTFRSVRVEPPCSRGLFFCRAKYRVWSPDGRPTAGVLTGRSEIAFAGPDASGARPWLFSFPWSGTPVAVRIRVQTSSWGPGRQHSRSRAVSEHPRWKCIVRVFTHGPRWAAAQQIRENRRQIMRPFR